MWAAFAAVTLLAASNAAASRTTNSDEALPLTKVVKLLETMKVELEKAADEDKDSWESIKCWCDTNEATKTKAIDDANSHISSLESTITESASKKAELTTEIDLLKKDIASNKEALAEATKLRLEEAAEFHNTEKNLIKNIGLLKGAITALSNQHAEFMQDGVVKPVAPMLRKMVHDNLDVFSFLRASPLRDEFLGFINGRDDLLEPDTPSLNFLQLPYKSYAPASGQIFGVLKQMKEAMEEDLPEAQKDEQMKSAQFAELKGAKEAEIKNQEESVEQKSSELGETKELLTNSKKDLEDTSDELSADRKFMLQLTKRCTEAADEWEKRKKLRSDEISAVSGAISILTADSVRDAQRGTFGSFLQLSMKADKKRDRAVRALTHLQTKTKYAGAEVQALVATAKLEPMEKVVKGIDDLVAKLKVQQADEVKQKDYCIQALHENEVQTTRKYAHKESLVADINDLAARHDTLEKEIESLKLEIADLQSQQQGAGENRVKESLEFQKTMRDQMTTKKALEDAYEKLADFYHKKASSLLQHQGKNKVPTTNALGEVDSPEFKPISANAGNMDAMGLIKKFIGEAKILMDDALSNEQNATEAYTEFLTDTNASIKAKSKLSADKLEELAEVDQTTEQKTLERDQTLEALQGLADIKKDLHDECDFLIENFTKRQEARLAEMDSLGEVKAILSGA